MLQISYWHGTAQVLGADLSVPKADPWPIPCLHTWEIRLSNIENG